MTRTIAAREIHTQQITYVKTRKITFADDGVAVECDATRQRLAAERNGHSAHQVVDAHRAVAAAIADAGLRTLLLDLTASGAASRATVESRFLRGVTDLLVGEAQFADKVLSAMRYEFGGHVEKPAKT